MLQKKTGIFKKLYIVAIIALVLLFTLPQTAYSGTTLITSKNITSNESKSIDPNIATSGTNVYVAYVDTDSANSDTDVFFTRSTNSGTDFETPYILDTTLTKTVVTSAANSGSVEIATSGNNVYVVWEENDPSDSNTDVYIAVNTNSGASGSWTVKPLSNDVGTTKSTSTTPKLAVSGSNVYVVWRDNADSETNIYISISTNSGSTFDTTTKLTTVSGANTPEIAASGDNVYVIWRDTNESGNSINFRGSNDKGATFSTETDLDSDSTNTKSGQKIVVSGSTIHVAWIEATGNDVLHRAITDNGGGSFTLVPTSSVDTIRDGSTALGELEIAASGNNVHAVWHETDANAKTQIYYSRSTNSGSTFGTPTNISSDTNNAITPQIAISGTNVFITWGVFVGVTNRDIFLKTSTDSGSTFGGRTTIQDHSKNASFEKIAVSGSTAYLVWEDDKTDTTTDPDVYFVSGTTSNIDFAFNQSTYKLSDTATIDVTAPDSNTDNGSAQTINVGIASDATGATSITITATETTSSSGIFRGTFTFDENSSNDSTDKIKAKPSSIITASFSSQSSTASIYSRTVAFGAGTYHLEDSARITVTDQNANTNTGSIETINVSVKSSNAPTSSSNPVTVKLTETGANTGIFGGASDATLRFMNNFDAIPLDNEITITQIDTAADTTSDPDTRTINVSTDTEGTVTAITLTETGGSTDTFTGVIKFISGTTAGTSKKATAGDFFTISGSYDLKGQIDGGTDNSKKAIRVNVAQGSPDTITATYGDATGTAQVQFASGEGGGGGGGLVRPTIVLNAVGAIALFGGTSINSGPPSFDNKVFTIKENGVTRTTDSMPDNNSKLEVGKQSNVALGFKLPGGITDLDHIGLYANIVSGQSKYDSDTYIYFDKYKDPQITIHDPHGFFKSVGIDVNAPSKSSIDVNFVFDFAKALDNTDTVFEAWTVERDAAEKDIPGLLNVIDKIVTESETKVTQEDIQKTQEVTNDKKPVPDWVKSNVKWWSEGEIDDKTFTNGIGFLISEKIIDVPVSPNISKSKDDKSEIVEESTIVDTKVPQWVKNNAKWWADESIDEKTFLTGIEYLVKHGIITITQS